ncbi:MAG: SGNH/GDSL hydrolase family protein [Clostridia bacterium]|nr:SGNH/GDSL hydrolase family protein [Clostridia bacterium]
MKKLLSRTLCALLSLFLMLPLVGVPAFATAELTVYGEQDFEALTEGAAVTKNDGFASVPTYSSVKKEENNKFVRIPLQGACITTSNHTGNVDDSLQIKHDYISYENGSFIVEAAFRPHWIDVTDIRGYDATKTEDPTIQCQFLTVAAQQNPNSTNVNYRGMFKINLRTGALSICGTTTGAPGLVQDEWNTIKLVIDPINAVYETYVNGQLYATEGYFGGDSNVDGGMRNISILADKLIIAKCNKNVGAYIDSDTYDDISYIDVDNVKIYEVPKATFTLNGETVKVSEGASHSLKTEGKRFIYATVKTADGTETITFEDSIVPEAGMEVTTHSIELSMLNPNVRTNKDSTGLRFVSKLGSADFDALKADPNVKDIKIGTLIVPEVHRGANPEKLTKDAFPGLKILDVEATVGAWYEGTSLTGYYLFAGSVTNIYEENYNMEFAANAYIEITMKDGTVRTIYAADSWETAPIASVANVAYTNLLSLGAYLDQATKDAMQPFADAYVADTTGWMQEELDGLDVLAIGDSTFGQDPNFEWKYQWVNWLGLDCNWNVTNLGYGGSSISKQPTQNQASISNNLLNNPDFKFGVESNGNVSYSTAGAVGKSADEVDVIFISSGFNDYGGSGIFARLGEFSKENVDISTYIGAWNVSLQKLLETYPNAKIVVVNQFYVTTAYQATNRGDTITCYEFTNTAAELVKELYADNERIFLLDSGNPILSGVDMMDSNFRKDYARSPGDYFHLNKNGMENFKTAIFQYVWGIAARDMK